MDWITEGVKFFGGLAGLASSLFLLYDRIFKLRPTIFLGVGGFGPELCVGNANEETLIVDEMTVTPHLVSIVMGPNLHETVRAAVDAFYALDEGERARTYCVLDGRSLSRFRLLLRKDFETAADDQEIEIRCYWRSSRKILPIRLHRKVVTSVRDLKDLKAESETRRERTSSG